MRIRKKLPDLGIGHRYLNVGELFFNDSIITDAFRCTYCKQILKPPVILTSTGNMCGHHDTQNGDTHDNYKVERSLRNIPMEQIMEHITCACSFKGRGCEEILKLYEISKHVQSCKFQTFTCMLADCEWSGVESDYVSHLHEHTDYIKKGSDGMFPLECGTEGTDNVLLLRTISGLSLLHMKVLKDKLICAVYDFENQYNESYKIWMTCLLSVSSKIHYEHLCQIVDSLHQFKNLESVEGTEIKFDNLNPVDNKMVKICLEHVFKGEIVSYELDDTVKHKNQFELLENMQVRLPCRNASLGCSEQHTFKFQHDKTSCYYKMWNCMIQKDCTFVGLFTKLVDHIENNHESIRHNEKTVSLSLNVYKIAFIVYDCVFILEYEKCLNEKADQSNYSWMKWRVLQFNHRSDVSAYFGVEITINSTNCLKSFYYKEGLKKCGYNLNWCELHINSRALECLLSRCSEAKVRIFEM